MKASVEHIRQKFAFTERRACRLLLVPVSSYRYQPRQNDNSLRERPISLAHEKPRVGHRRLHVLPGREGELTAYLLPSTQRLTAGIPTHHASAASSTG